jgi:hypothetical protein
MKASEVIEELSKLMLQYGDVRVTYDYDGVDYIYATSVVKTIDGHSGECIFVLGE